MHHRRSPDPFDAPAIERVGRRRPTASPPPAAESPAGLDQHGFRGRLEWGQAGVRALAAASDLVVVVDVLSFSTAISIAVERGAAVVPYRQRDGTAPAYARSIGAVLASPNRAAPGPTLSPSSLVALRAGDTMVLPSPNGATCVALAAEAGAMVVAGCLRNAAAVGRFAATRGGTTAVVAAGERWPDGTLRPSVEDLIGAGAILAAFEPAILSPEARAAVGAFRAVIGAQRTVAAAPRATASSRPARAAGGPSRTAGKVTQAAARALAEALRTSVSGRELVERGFAADVDIAAVLDATDRVPVLVDGVFTGGVR